MTLPLLCLITLAAVIVPTRISQVKADSSAIVYVDPPSVEDLFSPATFTIKVKVANVTDLYGVDVQLAWNPSLLEYVSHAVKIPVSTHPDGILNSPVLAVMNIVDPVAGTYWVAYASMLPAVGFNGGGTVFEMTFRVKGIGRCVIEITNADLSDSLGIPIARTVQHGFFSNYEPQPVDVMVSPRSIVDSTLTPCHTFRVNVTVINVVDLYDFDFWLDYNTTILDTVSVTVNPAFPPAQTLVEILEIQGRLHVRGWLIPPAASQNGNVVLATIEFHVTGTGATPLTLHDVLFHDSGGNVIPVDELLNGYFNNMLVTRMFVYPPELIDPTMKIGDIFHFEIKIENAIEMYDYKFKLSYDTLVLTCLGAVVIPPVNDTHFDVQIQVNDTEGYVMVYVQYFPPATPFSIYAAKTVTEITFQVQNYGQTVLHLSDTRISDQDGNNMSHITEDGFFATLLRDVAIVHVAVTSANKVYPGRIVTIEVIAMNRGNMTTETFDVTAYYDSNAIGTQTVTLGPWSNATLTFHWNTTGQTPCHNFTISARASLVPYELDPTNNVYYDGWVKIKLLGDVDGDGVIGILDVVAVTVIYHHHSTDPDWNPDADLAPPWGYIDLFDLVTLTSRYGQHCP
jgi:hypothetical protein